MSSSTFFLGGALRSSPAAGTSINTASTKAWSAMLVTMLRAVGAPNVLNMLFPSMVVTKVTTSMGRDEFDLQILDAQLREIDNPQNALVVQAVVDGQEHHALFRGLAAQGLRHARSQ